MSYGIARPNVGSDDLPDGIPADVVGDINSDIPSGVPSDCYREIPGKIYGGRPNDAFSDKEAPCRI